MRRPQLLYHMDGRYIWWCLGERKKNRGGNGVWGISSPVRWISIYTNTKLSHHYTYLNIIIIFWHDFKEFEVEKLKCIKWWNKRGSLRWDTAYVPIKYLSPIMVIHAPSLPSQKHICALAQSEFSNQYWFITDCDELIASPPFRELLFSGVGAVKGFSVLWGWDFRLASQLSLPPAKQESRTWIRRSMTNVVVFAMLKLGKHKFMYLLQRIWDPRLLRHYR